MRLTLVDNLLYEQSYKIRKFDLQPNLGLLSLAAVALELGHETQIYDPKRDLVSNRLAFDGSLYRNIADRILESTPDAVGLTTLGCNFHSVVKVAQHLRWSRPAMPILLGGPHATILHREILKRFRMFDVVVRHEAERTLPDVLGRLDGFDLGDIPGVSFRDRRGEILCNAGSPLIEDLDSLPVPAYDRYPLAELDLPTIRVEAGRGCPFSCTFCSTASFFGRNYRLKSPSRLRREMDHLHRTYGYTDFKLNHDLFTVNRKKVAEFCEAMLERQYTWSCSARMDCVDDELLSLMSRAGCRDIYFGVETGSERMQDLSRKRLDLGLVQPTLAAIEKLQMRATASFITGYPEENLEDQAQTLDLLGDLFCRGGGAVSSQLHLLTPEPGTALMAKYGNALLFDGHVTDFNFPRLEADDDALIFGDAVIFSNHHYYPTSLPRARHVFVTSLWMVLWVVGPAFLAYLLRAYDGRLSRFMSDAYDWYARRPDAGPVDGPLLVSFLRMRFGHQHHVVSLARYALAADSALSGRKRYGESLDLGLGDDARDVALVMAPHVVILRDIHDCIELSDRIKESESDRLLDDAVCGDLGHLLLMVGTARADADRGEQLTTYAVDNSTADLIARFGGPKTYWQCCLEIEAEGEASPLPEWKDIDVLCSLGVLRVCDGRGPLRATWAFP